MLRIWKQGLAVAVFLAPVIVVAQPPEGGPNRLGPGSGPGPDPVGGPLGIGPPPLQGSLEGLPFGGDIWNRPELQDRLDLSEDQIERLQQNRLKFETKRIEVQAKTEIARLTLESLVKKKEVDKAAVDSLIDELGNLHKENLRGLVQQKVALSEILNATQLERVELFLERSRERLRQRHFPEHFQGMRKLPSEMREGGARFQFQKDAMERGPKGEKRKEKKDRMGDPNSFGSGPRGRGGPGGPPPGGGFGGPGGRGQRGHGRHGGPGGPGFGGPNPGPGFGPPPPPPFPPSEFGGPSEGELPPPEDPAIDLGEPLEKAVEPAQE